MIIQCEQCRTKFKLDDTKVSDRGARVRCAKCRHVFTVQKPVEEPVAAGDVWPDLAAGAADQPTADETAVMAVAQASQSADISFGADPEVPLPATFDAAPADNSFDLSQTDAAAGSDFDFGGVSFSGTSSETPVDFGDQTMVMPPRQAVEPAPIGFGFDTPVSSAQDLSAAGETDFGFGELPAPAVDATAQDIALDFGNQAAAPAASSGDIDLGGFDFGEASSAAAIPEPAVAFSFDEALPQSAKAAGDSFDLSGVDFGAAQPEKKAAEVDGFSLGELDFSADTAAVAVDASAKTSASGLFAPVEESLARQQEVVTPDISFEAPKEEEPPLTISSRRRQSSTMSILIGVVAVVVLGVLGYVSYSFIGDGPKALSLFGKPSVPVEEGKITVQNIKATFVAKAAAGELLVISGEALNGFKKTRAALQVKVAVFGANNQVLVTKTAYAGNPLTQEQLLTMPAEKIEAAMNNQFGDSLANLEVQPGKAIPFTLVIINPPADGKDFGVEPVGSTVAAAK